MTGLRHGETAAHDKSGKVGTSKNSKGMTIEFHEKSEGPQIHCSHYRE